MIALSLLAEAQSCERGCKISDMPHTARSSSLQKSLFTVYIIIVLTECKYLCIAQFGALLREYEIVIQCLFGYFLLFLASPRNEAHPLESETSEQLPADEGTSILFNQSSLLASEADTGGELIFINVCEYLPAAHQLHISPTRRYVSYMCLIEIGA